MTGQTPQAPAPPKPAAASPTPDEMIGPELRSFLEAHLRSGSPVTVEVGKVSFTGRIFRLMLHEGWIAVEHVDGRRRAFWVYQGGTIAGADGGRIPLGGGHAG